MTKVCGASVLVDLRSARGSFSYELVRNGSSYRSVIAQPVPTRATETDRPWYRSDIFALYSFVALIPIYGGGQPALCEISISISVLP
jgi:hypothetical protein